MPKGNAVFLDTSIQIARIVHNDELEVRIACASHNMT